MAGRRTGVHAADGLVLLESPTGRVVRRRRLLLPRPIDSLYDHGSDLHAPRQVARRAGQFVDDGPDHNGARFARAFGEPDDRKPVTR